MLATVLCLHVRHGIVRPGYPRESSGLSCSVKNEGKQLRQLRWVSESRNEWMSQHPNIDSVALAGWRCRDVSYTLSLERS